MLFLSNWIVKPSKRKNYSRIVAAVDPDPALPESAGLNKKILNLAISLARQENSKLNIVHAWFVQGEGMLRRMGTALTKSEVDEIFTDIKNKHKGWLDDLLSQHDMKGVDSKIHLVKGEAGKVIPSLVNKQRADIVVMGTVARTGIKGIFIGNTAEKILRNVDCSVLTVKPDSFETPVKV